VAAGVDEFHSHRRGGVGPEVDGWIIWQIHGRARIDGISGGVDLDIMRSPV
jgi:hypothetical protein